MKMIVVVALALVAAAAAAPAEYKEPVKIVRSELKQDPENGGYVSSVETENGIKTEVEGKLKTVLNEENKEVQVLVVRGSYEYPGEDGKPVFVTYIADEAGYRAKGDSIPKEAAARR